VRSHQTYTQEKLIKIVGKRTAHQAPVKAKIPIKNENAIIGYRILEYHFDLEDIIS
jgi:hypothetical protein